jgi:hypothetical protein
MFEDYKAQDIEDKYYKGTDYYLIGNYVVRVIFGDTIYINNQELLWRRMPR